MRASFGPLGRVTTVRHDSFSVSGPDGDVSPGTDLGFYVRDTRFLNRLELRLDGEPVRPLSGGPHNRGQAIFHGFIPPPSGRSVESTLLVERHRFVDGGLHEGIVITNAAPVEAHVDATFGLGTDFAYIFDVKHGRMLPTVAADSTDDHLTFSRPGGVERITVTASQDDGPVTVVADDLGANVSSRLSIPAGGSVRLCLDVTVTDVYGTARPGRRCTNGLDEDDAPAVRRGPRVDGADRSLVHLLRQSMVDLDNLLLPDPDAPTDRFAAAGSPWFLTLFGRDSLWAALMALPFDPDLALGTLRTLARRQGQRVDHETEEAPGKILHEVRRGALTDRGDLPPNYYGSVDATPLFVIVAHEAWRWGVDEEAIAALVPHVERALGWLVDHGDADGDGFIEYVRHGSRGLANQGWKDSADGIRHGDGRLAEAPMALAEVQGYAYAAARRGAELLDAFDRPGGADWRRWADDLAGRFRSQFWVSDDAGRFPAVALDRDKRRVDSVASNMGHLLFTGILDDTEAAQVAARLGAGDMDSGWGLRTLSADSGGYNPLSYHCGSVWPHDTAIAVWGLSRMRCDAVATRLLQGIVRAAPTFDYRLPELYSGIPAGAAPRPVPCPTACQPQAWSAAGALLLLRAALGIEADVPAGRLTLRPLRPLPFDDLEVTGLRLGAGSLDLRLDGDLDVTLHGSDVDVTIEAAPPG